MDNKKKLLLDVDEVICFAGFLNNVNAFLQTNYVIDDIEDYYIEDAVIPKDRMQEFIKFSMGRSLYKDAYILPGAVDTIKLLNDVYNIYICSSCINPFIVEDSGQLFKEKYDFLLKIIPFIKPEKFIFTNAKHMINADIMIDDRLPNLSNHIPIKILFPSYHNKKITDAELSERKIIRAGYEWRNGWNEVKNILIDNNQILTNQEEKVYIKKV